MSGSLAVGVIVGVIFLAGTFLGNYTTSQQTIRDCATKGHVVMYGAPIKCEVVKQERTS